MEQEASTQDVVMPKVDWSVQVRAFCQEVDAKTLIQDLRSKGYEAFSLKAVVKGRLWPRVRVGDLETKDEAQDLRDTLKSIGGFSDAFLVNNSIVISQTEKAAKPTKDIELVAKKLTSVNAKSLEIPTTK